ncbi:hypothetical protein ACX0G9_02480 [Flavitalea flava]
MHYTTIEELLLDDGFLAWYHKSDEEQERKWKEWITANEPNLLLAQEASGFLDGLHVLELAERAKGNAPTPNQVDELFRHILREIDSGILNSEKDPDPYCLYPHP